VAVSLSPVLVVVVSSERQPHQTETREKQQSIGILVPITVRHLQPKFKSEIKRVLMHESQARASQCRSRSAQLMAISSLHTLGAAVGDWTGPCRVHPGTPDPPNAALANLLELNLITTRWPRLAWHKSHKSRDHSRVVVACFARETR